jgi:hypothetical protein
MANTFRGKKRTLLTFKRLKPAVRTEIGLAMGANARDMAATARRFAPQGETGELIDSIKAIEERGTGGVPRWKVVAGDERAFCARMVEFGTAPGKRGEKAVNASGRARTVARTHPGTPAQPFFFVAYRALRRRMKGRLTRAFRKARAKAIS